MIRMTVIVLIGLLCLTTSTMAQSSSTKLREAVNFHRQANLEEAVTRYREIIDTSSEPTDIREARFAVAGCLYAQKKLDMAIVAFDEYATLYPLDSHAPLALVFAGNCRMDQGQVDNASVYYKKALAIRQDPHSMNVWEAWANLGMGRVLVAKADAKAALPHLIIALEKAPEPRVATEATELIISALETENAGSANRDTTAKANFRVGQLFHNRKEHVKALPYLRRAVAEATEGCLLSDSYIMLGESLNGTDQPYEALKAFQAVKSVKDKPGSDFMKRRSHFLGVAAIDEITTLATVDRTSEALAVCEQALALCKDDPHVEYWVLSDLRRAQSYILDSLDKYPTSGE